MRRIPATVLGLALAARIVLPVPARAEEGLLERYSATDRFRSGSPRAFAIVPGGREVLFLRSGPRDRVNDLWSLDVATGRERVLLTAAQLLAGAQEALTPEERARRERMRLSARGIAGFELSRDGARVLVPLSGRLFVLERASGAVRELSPGAPPAEDARFSPEGARVACLRGGDLCAIDLATGAERVVVAHEGAGVTWGRAEFVAQEEMGRFEGWWWSPDAKRLLVQRTDESHVETLRISDPAHPEAPLQEWAYPRPGRTNADVRLAILPADGAGERVDVTWDRARWPYLCRALWPAGGAPVLVVMDRGQHEAAVLAVDAATGATRVRFTETDSLWLNLSAGSPRALAGGRSLLWIAERDDSGPWLERRTDGAPPVRLTPPGLRVLQLVAVDEPKGVAWVIASDDPLESHLWRVPLAGRGAPKRMGADVGEETATFAESGSMHVRALRPVRGIARWSLEDGDGRMLAIVRSLAESPGELPPVEYVRVGADSLNACIVRPRDFDPRRRYPVVEWAYGGPHYCQVTRVAAAYVLEQWLADQGFVVVCVDGRGTPRRGRTWERAIRGDLVARALADHVQGVRALCPRYPQLDPDRVGATGWSFGGTFAVFAVEREPSLYRAAVAGAPVVDWRDYDTFYTERYLGLPAEDSLAYARSSPLTYAADLVRPLLVIHGTADDNVYFFNSLKLADALNRAGRSWSFLPLPGQTHGPIEAAQVRQVYGRMAEFFQRELGGPGDAAPPRP